MNKKRIRRSPSGAAIITLMLIIGMIVLPLLGILSFEIGRAILATQQLKHALDASSLAAACSLASQDNANPTVAQQNAIDCALAIFRKNSIVGGILTETDSSDTLAGSLNPGQALIKFEFQDPISRATVLKGDSRGKMVKASGRVCLSPAFGKFLGIGQYEITSVSSGRVPNLDVVLCFDVSGSMDDETPATCVRRKWSASAGKIVYDVASGSHGPANKKIFDFLQPASTGSSLNGLEPQNLDDAYFNANLNFSEYLARYYSVPGLRSLGGYPDQGKPPGNYPPGTAPTFDGFGTFTDMVVNIDGNNVFSGFSYNGYNFPDLATLVEASRGNLEDPVVFEQSKANTAVTVAPKAGYRKAFQDAAKLRLQPLKDSVDCSTEFINIMNVNTVAHFGFVSFDAAVGTEPLSTKNWINVDETIPYGIETSYPMPRVKIDNTPGTTRYSEVKEALSRCIPLGATNIGRAIHEAVKDINAGGRKGSMKAIILFTDGQPTVPGGPLDSDPMVNARMAAVEARDAGIAIHAIGLATNPALLSQQFEILNADNPSTTAGGIAAIAGHGGTFHQVTNSGELRLAFEKIARSLSRIVTSI
jgi:hypothetical protein